MKFSRNKTIIQHSFPETSASDNPQTIINRSQKTIEVYKKKMVFFFIFSNKPDIRCGFPDTQVQNNQLLNLSLYSKSIFFH